MSSETFWVSNINCSKYFYIAYVGAAVLEQLASGIFQLCHDALHMCPLFFLPP
jgi:hypothetical protein